MVSRRKAIAGAFRHLQDKKILIAPGHGGYNGIGARTIEGREYRALYTNPDTVRLPTRYTGAFNEEQLNIMIVTETLLIMEHARANARVCPGTFAYKACVAEGWQPEVFIEVHCNSARADADGIEIWTDGDNESVILAMHLLTHLTGYTGLGSRGLKDMESEDNVGTWKDQHDALFEHLSLDKRRYPLVLVECGFLSSDKDAAFLTALENHEKIATAICHGLDVFFESKSEGIGAGGSSLYDATS